MYRVYVYSLSLSLSLNSMYSPEQSSNDVIFSACHFSYTTWNIMFFYDTVLTA